MELKDFIKTYPNFKDCTIQTFDDRSKDQSLARKFAVDWVDRSLIKTLNDSGAGVFFSVNSMQHWTRSKSTVTNLNAWIVECDDLPKENQMNLINNAPIKPSCVIESNKSYHIYYFAEDATNENWERVNRWLREYYHWDQAICSDTARVLRLPWTYHNKWEPYKITCLYCDDVRYNESDMMTAFSYSDPIKEHQEIKKIVVTKARDIWELMSMQSSRYMLDRLSWSRLVRWERIEYKKNSNWSEQIRVNGESTWAWIDHNDKIWSAKDGWPTWIQWCQFYWNSKWDIARWFTEFCDDLIPEEFNRSIQIKEIEKIEKKEQEEKLEFERGTKLKHISQADRIMRWFHELIDTNPQKIMKWWRNEWDGFLWGIYGWKVYLIWADTWVGKTTFVNQIANNLSSAGVRVTRYSLEDRLEDNAKEDIFYTTNQRRVQKWKNKIEWIKFINWEYTHSWWENFDQDILDDIIESAEELSQNQITDLDKDKDVTIDDMVALMSEECDRGTRVFFIDHLHYFQFDNNQTRMDLQIENAMKAINEIARKRDVAVFIIAHYNWSIWAWRPTLNSFKWSTGIKQIANIVIQIERDDDTDITEFTVSKIRWPIKKRTIEARFDITTYSYSFTKSIEQKQKEKENKAKFWK